MPVRVLIWQWGRRGAGPRFASELAQGLRRSRFAFPMLSLSRRAEILLEGPAESRPACDLQVDTYAGLAGLLRRCAGGPLLLARLCHALSRLRPDIAICAMAAPLDLLMAAALALRGIRFALIVHEVDSHPGDHFAVQYRLQALLMRRAALLVPLTRHVAEALAQQAGIRPERILLGSHPPFGLVLPIPRRTEGTVRLLLFGRLLPYKGLDLLADALALLGPNSGLAVRVVGEGPPCAALDRLRALPGVSVENGWVPEADLPTLFAWCDAVVLAHREASQSGVAAMALGAGRRVIATEVGGLPEQLAGVAAARLCAPHAQALAQAIGETAAEITQAATAAAPLPQDLTGAWRTLGEAIILRLAEAPVQSPLRPVGSPGLSPVGARRHRWGDQLLPRIALARRHRRR